MPRDLPIGNGRMLVTFDQGYNLRDLFFPRVGQENHTAGQPCRFGVWADGEFSWLENGDWARDLRYEEDALVTRGERDDGERHRLSSRVAVRWS